MDDVNTADPSGQHVSPMICCMPLCIEVACQFVHLILGSGRFRLVWSFVSIADSQWVIHMLHVKLALPVPKEHNRHPSKKIPVSVAMQMQAV